MLDGGSTPVDTHGDTRRHTLAGALPGTALVNLGTNVVLGGAVGAAFYFDKSALGPPSLSAPSATLASPSIPPPSSPPPSTTLSPSPPCPRDQHAVLSRCSRPARQTAPRPLLPAAVVQEKIKDNTRKEVDDPMLKGDSEFFFAEKAKDPGE